MELGRTEILGFLYLIRSQYLSGRFENLIFLIIYIFRFELSDRRRTLRERLSFSRPIRSSKNNIMTN